MIDKRKLNLSYNLQKDLLKGSTESILGSKSAKKFEKNKKNHRKVNASMSIY
jgi:hypothetical protein